MRDFARCFFVNPCTRPALTSPHRRLLLLLVTLLVCCGVFISTAHADDPPAAVTVSTPTYGEDPMLPGGGEAVQLAWTANTEADLASYKIYRATHATVTQSDTLVATVLPDDPMGTSCSDWAATASPTPGTTRSRWPAGRPA